MTKYPEENPLVLGLTIKYFVYHLLVVRIMRKSPLDKFLSSIDNNSGNFQRLIVQYEGSEILKAIAGLFSPR